MKLKVRSLMCLVLLNVVTIGCGGGGEARNATEGASKSAIEEYEAAVKAAEGSMTTKEDETAPVEAASPAAEPAAEK
jgi:outer membrane lipoprotein-sorting protein